MYSPICCVYDDDEDLYMMGDGLNICISHPSASCYAKYCLDNDDDDYLSVYPYLCNLVLTSDASFMLH